MGLFNFEDGSKQKEEIKPLKENLSEEVKKSERVFNEEEYDEDQAELVNLDLESAHSEADKIMNDLRRRKSEEEKKK